VPGFAGVSLDTRPLPWRRAYSPPPHSMTWTAPHGRSLKHPLVSDLEVSSEAERRRLRDLPPQDPLRREARRGVGTNPETSPPPLRWPGNGHDVGDPDSRWMVVVDQSRGVQSPRVFSKRSAFGLFDPHRRRACREEEMSLSSSHGCSAAISSRTRRALASSLVSTCSIEAPCTR
jgi:hypothetical protein